MNITVHIRNDQKLSEIRKEGNVPAIIYGKHIKNSLSVICKKNDFLKIFKETGYSTTITVKGEGVEELVLVQDLQLDPVSNVLLHIDFLAVNKNEKVTTEVPVILVGESPIQKTGEGKIQLLKDFVEVEAFPQDLPHDITIDISKIERLHDTIFVKDLTISSKVKILDDQEQPILTVVDLGEDKEETPVVAAAAPVAPAK